MDSEKRAGFSEFGALLRRHRLAAGLSQDALAERARMSSAAISALERGQRRTPQRETFALLAGALALEEKERREFEAAAARPPSVRRGGASVTVGPWMDAAESALPLALTRFVGRATELAEIGALMREYRLVTLTGSGGVGKTQTALQAASALRDTDGATMYFVGLGPLADPSLVASTIALALGVQEVPNRPLLETLIAYLKNKALFLILDNCEHVIGEAASVAYTLLLQCPKLRILATSREALRTAGERAYRLPSLSVAEAVELFTDRACAADHHFALSEENGAVVADLCRRVDSIPLAIEMAAARVQTFTPREMLTMLEHRFGLLSLGDRAAPTRQQTMWATLDWSYQLLTDREKMLFERLSVFVGGCTLEAATAVCAGEAEDDLDVANLLASLAAKSLLTADVAGDGERYSLLESTRHYAYEKLLARGDIERVVRRHALYYVERAEEKYNQDSVTLEQELPKLGAESGNWRAALAWALVRRGDVVLGQRLAALNRILWHAFPPTEARTWVRLALEAVDEATPPQYVARLEFADGAFAAQCGEFRHGVDAARRALTRFRELGDVRGVAHVERLLGLSLHTLGECTEGERLLHSALEAARALGDRRLTMTALHGIGYARARLGDFSGARAALREAIELGDAAGDPLSRFVSTMALATNELNAGDPTTALRLIDDVLATHQRRNTLASIPIELLCEAQLNTSECLTALARYDEAMAGAKAALDLARRGGLAALVVRGVYRLAMAALRRPRGSEGNAETLERLATLLGFVDMRRKQYGSESFDEFDSALGTLRDALGADEVTRLTAAGSAMSESEATVLVDALV